jgi:hypothetical protein
MGLKFLGSTSRKLVRIDVLLCSGFLEIVSEHENRL